MGSVLVFRNVKRGRPALTLAAEGVDYLDASVKFTVSWDEVTDIVGIAPKGKTFRPVVFERKDGPPVVIANAAARSPGGRALFWMIRHYWLHRAVGAELVNGVAVERLTSGRFAAE